MATNSGYRVNEDGSVTKINGGGSNNGNNNSGGSSGNSGCVWIIIIAIVIGVIIAISNSGSSDVSDYSDTVVAVEEEAVVEEIIVEEVYTPSTTYLSVSDDDIYMSSSGGSTDITISTDGDWEIEVGVASWGHLTKYSNSVTLRLDENNSSSSRTDYFVIKSGDYTKRINITQRGDTTPKADIENIWVDNNVYQN